MGLKKLIVFFLTGLLFSTVASAQVLGACGDTSKKPQPVKKTVQPVPLLPPINEMAVKPVPLPGQQAINFALPAVVVNQIKTVKLSDYAGKWRVLCFFPAAFTFV